MGNNNLQILEIAVIGHPNEGKSSVVSTLIEDDQIKVSRIPGETKISKTYTVEIDNESVIRFVDTPGFQAPQQTLEWFMGFNGEPDKILDEFIEKFRSDELFIDECELLTPVARGAGIIYVVNGSRPVRPDDLAEMEILRLTGRPRMAVINSKSSAIDYTNQWLREFRKYFNAIRIFNSNKAGFNERIRMMESLKSIDQSWEEELSRVIDIFKTDMKRRKRLVCAYITHAIEKNLGLVVSAKLKPESDPEEVKRQAIKNYQDRIREIEAKMFQEIRSLFKHNIYDIALEDHNILNYDLFSRKTWDVLGITRKQLAGAGALLGGSAGAMIDIAAHGLTFGIFTTIGGILGISSAVIGGNRLAKSKKNRFGGDSIQVGPNKNLQFIYVLLDRALIYYTYMINRPHGRRDNPKEDHISRKIGISVTLSSSQRDICATFFKVVSRKSKSLIREKKEIKNFVLLIDTLIDQLSD